MPELPEVEIVKQSLDKNIKFQKIKKVVVRNRNLRFKISKDFEVFLTNKKIVQISRKAKYLILYLSNNTFCIIHLGMSGTIHLLDKNNSINNTNSSFYNSPNLPSKHNHIEIFLKKCRLIYNDPRRFGFIKIFKNKKILLKFFNNIGPEPLNKKFNINYIFDYFINKKKKHKKFSFRSKVCFWYW